MSQSSQGQPNQHQASDDKSYPARPPASALSSRRLPPANVHPTVAIIGVACYVWFMLMSWWAFDHGTTALDLALSTLIFVMIIGLFLKCVSMARNMTPEREERRDFEVFLQGSVDTYTGWMSGRQAMVEILLPPVTLAIAATAFCAVARAYGF